MKVPPFSVSPPQGVRKLDAASAGQGFSTMLDQLAAPGSAMSDRALAFGELGLFGRRQHETGGERSAPPPEPPPSAEAAQSTPQPALRDPVAALRLQPRTVAQPATLAADDAKAFEPPGLRETSMVQRAGTQTAPPTGATTPGGQFAEAAATNRDRRTLPPSVPTPRKPARSTLSVIAHEADGAVEITLAAPGAPADLGETLRPITEALAREFGMDLAALTVNGASIRAKSSF